MICNECNFCKKKRGASVNNYECKRPVYSKIYNRPIYAYMDVNPDDQCHYRGVLNEESEKDRTTEAAAC